jgi:hypothetical protein
VAAAVAAAADDGSGSDVATGFVAAVATALVVAVATALVVAVATALAVAGSRLGNRLGFRSRADAWIRQKEGIIMHFVGVHDVDCHRIVAPEVEACHPLETNSSCRPPAARPSTSTSSRTLPLAVIALPTLTPTAVTTSAA